MNQWAYSREAVPSCPELPAVIRRSWSSGPTLQLTLTVDTGAFMTGLPLIALRKLRARQVDVARVEDYEGRLNTVPVFEIDVDIDGRIFPCTKVIGLEYQGGFIGRDILNKFVTSLDGPGEETRLSL